MKLEAEIEYIKSELDKTQDIHLIQAIKSILDYSKSKRYANVFEPMSSEDFFARNKLSQKSIKEGDLIDQAEARAYFINK